MRRTLIIILLFAFGCGPKLTSWTTPGYEGKKYEKIIIFGITKNLAARQRIEDNSVLAFQDKGVDAIKGLTVVKPGVSFDDLNVEEVVAQLKAIGVDGMLTWAVVDKEESTTYVPGTNTYVGGYGGRGRYGGFGGYYGGAYGRVYDPGYYKETTTYVLETNFYKWPDTGEESGLVWQGQTSVTDPGNPKKASKKYATFIVNELFNLGVVNP